MVTIIRRRGDKILQDEFDTMVFWVRERDSIRLKREKKLPPPWTEDPFLSVYRWCNVRRMDDRVSLWLLDWHRHHPEFGIRDRMVAAAAGRLINWPETLQTLPYPIPYDAAAWSKKLLARKARGLKVFTGAYIINGALGGDKILQVTDKILTPLWKDRSKAPADYQKMQEVYDYLNGKKGIGSFMAGQVAADLRYIHHEYLWTDRYTWAPRGPGSIRGVNRLIGQPLSRTMPIHEWLDVVRQAYAKARLLLPKIYLRLELMDQQNILCEYDKYQRLRRGEGSVRSRYTPHGE
jgi:hypothetical protein